MKMEYDTINMRRCEVYRGEMWDLASAHFESHPECQFVLVNETAGWMLGYRRDGSIWTTANDRAVLDSGARPRAWSGVEVSR